MANPLGSVKTNDANLSTPHHARSYSTFDKSLSYRLYNTLRFGEYMPTFVMEGVPKDRITINSKDSVDSLSLEAPFKGMIRKTKDSFMVPNMALLPLNWDKIYAQPAHGDDVPINANCVIENFPQLFTQFHDKLRAAYNAVALSTGNSSNSETNWANYYTGLVRTAIIGEMIYSNGSLLSSLGYSAAPFFSYNWIDPSVTPAVSRQISYDEWFDLFCERFFGSIASFSVTIPGQTGAIVFQGLYSGNANVGGFQGAAPFRAFLELARENPLWQFSSASFRAVNMASDGTIGTTVVSSWQSFTQSASATLRPNLFGLWGEATHPNLPVATEESVLTNDETALTPTRLNLSRVLSYQMICMHYYSNSAVDFLYSADLYRQYIRTLEVKFQTSSSSGWSPAIPNAFTWNSYSIPYDYLSGNFLSGILGINQAISSGLGNLSNFLYLSYLGGSGESLWQPWIFVSYSAIFAYRKSLRYADYFTGSRPLPLAPVNTQISVNSGMVDVIDVTRRIAAQRFGNAVMRSRSKIEEYTKSLFGTSVAPDYHNPFFLAKEQDALFADEVQNTGEAQTSEAQSRTSLWASRSGRYSLTFRNDDGHPCIYMQIVSFDIPRAYTRTIDRQFFHADRFDMFNPDFQYIGDQPIYGSELGFRFGQSGVPNIFAYTSRDMEYKQRFDVAHGGFVENLPGWAMTDRTLALVSQMNNPGISPDFIRSTSCELDPFYLSLTGYSLGSYFHFIFVTDNNVSASRPMAVDPQILQ